MDRGCCGGVCKALWFVIQVYKSTIDLTSPFTPAKARQLPLQMTLYWFQHCSKTVISLSNRNSHILAVLINTCTYRTQCVPLYNVYTVFHTPLQICRWYSWKSSLILPWPIHKNINNDLRPANHQNSRFSHRFVPMYHTVLRMVRSSISQTEKVFENWFVAWLSAWLPSPVRCSKFLGLTKV